MNIEIPDEYFTQEELKNTPKRVRRFLKEWNNNTDFDFKTFDNPSYDEMIILKDIDFSSLCAHHLLTFTGFAHIGYIPYEKICGVSKLARAVDKFSSKPQLQERLTQEIADFLTEKLEPKGLMVVLEASHSCMSIRGVKKKNSIMVTSAIKGVFKDKEVREEFLTLIKK